LQTSNLFFCRFSRLCRRRSVLVEPLPLNFASDFENCGCLRFLERAREAEKIVKALGSGWLDR
jgi:hypothetical protein